MKKLHILGLLAAIGFTACKPNLTPNKPSNGGLNFERYVAVGNSLTAGYSDGSLTRTGQLNSYPAMLAKQFATVGGGEFKQPLLQHSESGYPGAKYILTMKKGLCDMDATLSVVPFPGALDTAGESNNIAYLGPFNNVGVPGIRCIDYIVPGYAAIANQYFGLPYANRFFTAPSVERPVDEARRAGATFFSIWLGSNDVLLYATAGGEGSPIGISPIEQFTIAYDSVITMMTRYGAKGVAINIPDITAIPFFTTVPANGLTLTRDQAQVLNDLYNNTNIKFHEGAGNYFVVQDTNTTLKFRQIQDGEYVLLSIPQDSIKCKGWGASKPIPATYILDSKEVAKVTAATNQFNSVIAQMAAAHNTPVVDMHSYLRTVATGIKFNGVTYSTQFVSGGAFSLDGVHPTPRGYALIANQIINTINSYYGSTVPLIDVSSYTGVKLP